MRSQPPWQWFKANETHETHDPPNSYIEGNGEHGGDDDEDELIDFSHRCWKVGIDQLPGTVGQHSLDIDRIWLNDFPPPQGFTGYESHPYGEKGYARYERACSAEEIAILEADIAAAKAAERAEQEELRDTWFALLQEWASDE